MAMQGSQSIRFSIPRDILAPMAYLLLVMWLDHVTIHVTILPLFGIVGLLLMAYFIRPLWVVFWCVIYTGAVVAVFLMPVWGFFLRWVSPPHDLLTPYLRTITFVIASIMASRLSLSLNRLDKVTFDLIQIFDSLSSPLIASDHNGKIRYLNAAAQKLLTNAGRLEVGSSVFALAPKDHQGRMIADYLARFRGASLSEPLEVEINGKRLSGSTKLMGSTSPKLLVTMVAAPDAPAKEGHVTDSRP
jgi:PAS domain-containing protein